ncbi:hypothetical protein H261_23182 [Paramagnetospirillum caucaseum]|uniref:Uncharacterized protein n=1 Tax=Paramagnetospirillum caucaseum TaxID=1244869 RepID=M3A3P3_9PROT|nr:hypothetical protein H261_23182 [Paramagnetospirillum caucaseum]
MIAQFVHKSVFQIFFGDVLENGHGDTLLDAANCGTAQRGLNGIKGKLRYMYKLSVKSHIYIIIAFHFQYSFF